MKYKCCICEKEFSRNNGLAYHLKFTHNITFKEHYDKYLKSDKDGTCLVCGKPTSWRGSSYLLCCSSKCGSIFSKEKRENTMLERYGAKTTLESNILKDKVKTTCIEKYNNENPGSFGSDLFKSAMKSKYGVESYLETFSDEQRTAYGKLGHTDNANNKHAQTCLDKYGVLHPMHCADISSKTRKKYLYDGNVFDSSWELAYYIWLHDHNIDYTYQPNIQFKYEYNGSDHYYNPDFIVNDEIQEIKGLQFFKDKDINNTMINPFDSTLNGLYEAKHKCMLSNNVKIITDCTEYVNYVEAKYTKDFLGLFKTNLEFPYPDNNIIKKYHHSIYDAHRENYISPTEAWKNKDLILKSALNRLKYVNSCKPSDVLQGFNVAKIAPKVSVFKRTLAKRLIDTYLNEFSSIFDPFSGFSGRLLGTCDCNKQYIGQDINQIHVNESNNLINDLKLNAAVTCKDIFDSYGEYECLFTCSPYNLKEQWNENETDLSCDQWIDVCLKRFKCKKYLFVVDNTEQYKDNIVETIENKSHFGNNTEYVILINCKN